MSPGSELRGKVAIVGAADTAVGVLPGRTPMELCVDAALQAIADAGLDKSDVDGLLTCNAMAQPLLYHAEALAEYLEENPSIAKKIINKAQLAAQSSPA